MASYVECKNGVIRKRKTHCKHGHEFDGTEKWNTNWRGFSCRVCRVCCRERIRRKRLNPERKAQDREKAARYRKNNPEAYKASWVAAGSKKRQILLDARAGGCVHCPEKDPACLDFHHRDPGEKEGHIGEFRRFGMERLLAEIAKCDVLCANCHRKHHRNERQKSLEGV